MPKRKMTNEPSPNLVPVQLSDAIDATGTNDPELAQRLVNQVYETLWMPAELSEEERVRRTRPVVYGCEAPRRALQH